MGGITYRLHPKGRLNAFYLRSDGLLCVVGALADAVRIPQLDCASCEQRTALISFDL